ncbi:MAG TPA: hypothetical protein VGL10_01645, partial [Gammaproteobacteria bacterium]
RPQYAIATADYRNRYGFPKPDVIARWREEGAAVLVTGYAGAVDFKVEHDRGIVPPVLWRQAGRRYWHHTLDPGYPALD